MLFPKWMEYKKLHGASESYLKRLNADWRNYYEGTEIVTIPLAELTKITLDVWAHELIHTTNKTKKQFYNISTIIHQMLDYAVDAELIPENVFLRQQKHIRSYTICQMTDISSPLTKNISAVREMAGHADERTTLNSYCYDRSTDAEKILLVEKALA